MDYQEAMDYINNTNKFGIKLGLDIISKILKNMGNPEKNLKIIHVAGTNGKGSTCSFLSHILRCASYKVGLYTSPYLECFEERLRINGENIPKEKLVYYVEYIKPIIDKIIEEGYDCPTEFELITAIAFKYFYDEEVDFVVLEVGLGGRFDATNAIEKSLLSIITTIDYDHMDRLGNTIEGIAYEKAGIIKQNGNVVSCFQNIGALNVIKDVCKDKNATLTILDKEDINIKEMTSYKQIFDFKGFKSLEIRLIGKHQVYNASLAVLAIINLKKYNINIDEECIRKGLVDTTWPGRLEVISRSPLVVIDGAHNLQGIRVLKDALELFTYKKLILVVGMLRDKDTENMLNLIVPEADIVIATMPISDRAYTAEELSKRIKRADVVHFEDIDAAARYALSKADSDDMVLFSGSLYMIGHLRSILKNVIFSSSH
ncbi:bifunctional folylpolyglutamate synthase/dihydrofolate synthase [Aceticella autotrophica]|uniref:tetrahydrofolate synthase n=1 Tax=Aceticella autotrophica TaxID=2755338 RepID=A0A975AWL7_9THEO|nr:folylpolyglutamate synthase/dihydrofolate synthase family protein [Aceticella autotrophica]QSZ27826.1 bifunctional folylpolyglutamate synthase/dihydrofolate synthase [Aceticella autotrophica]